MKKFDISTATDKEIEDYCLEKFKNEPENAVYTYFGAIFGKSFAIGIEIASLKWIRDNYSDATQNWIKNRRVV